MRFHIKIPSQIRIYYVILYKYSVLVVSFRAPPYFDTHSCFIFFIFVLLLVWSVELEAMRATFVNWRTTFLPGINGLLLSFYVYYGCRSKGGCGKSHRKQIECAFRANGKWGDQTSISIDFTKLFSKWYLLNFVYNRTNPFFNQLFCIMCTFLSLSCYGRCLRSRISGQTKCSQPRAWWFFIQRFILRFSFTAAENSRYDRYECSMLIENLVVFCSIMVIIINSNENNRKRAFARAAAHCPQRRSAFNVWRVYTYFRCVCVVNICMQIFYIGARLMMERRGHD